MTKQQEISKQEKLVDAYREEFNQYRAHYEASRQRVLREKAKLQNMKAEVYFLVKAENTIELNA